MTSALRTRAMTEATTAVGTGARVEPVFTPNAGEPPVLTDEVKTGRLSLGRRAAESVRFLLARSLSVARRVNLLALALVVLGMGLAVFAMGLVLYFSSRSAPVVAPAVAPVLAPVVAPLAALPPAGAASVEPTTLPPEGREPNHEAASKTLPAVQEAKAADPAPPVEPLAMAASAVAAPGLPASAARVGVDVPGPVEALPAAAPTVNEPEPLADATYGVDANLNGVPDVLDRWLTRTLLSQATQEAARQYYRTVLPLATKLQFGVALSSSEKLSALRAAECYLITATEEGLRVPPNLNDRVLIQGGDAAERMKSLFKELQGVDFPVSASRRGACT